MFKQVINRKVIALYYLHMLYRQLLLSRNQLFEQAQSSKTANSRHLNMKLIDQMSISYKIEH